MTFYCSAIINNSCCSLFNDGLNIGINGFSLVMNTTVDVIKIVLI